jgi:hypothetical protein
MVSMEPLKQRNRSLVVESSYGVCLWEIDGKYLSDGDGYLSMEGFIGDREIEAKMQEAAYYWLDERLGHAKWVPGARKISEMEWEEQNDRLLSGLIPDPVEEIRQRIRRGKN